MGFIGAHCYVVTRRGAETLLQHATPIQLHMDFYIACSAYLGYISCHIWPVSLASQWATGTSGAWPLFHSQPARLGIGHWDMVIGWKRFVPDVQQGFLFRASVLLLVLLLLRILVRTK
jgi:hypothetical protein